MRTRAYRPAIHDCLEERSLLSGVGRPSHRPVVLLESKLESVVEHMESTFLLLFQNKITVPTLRDDLNDVGVNIPFGKVDGLGVKINRIVNRMQRERLAGVPHAIGSASDDVIAVTLADVKARVQSGSVVIVKNR